MEIARAEFRWILAALPSGAFENSFPRDPKTGSRKYVVSVRRFPAVSFHVAGDTLEKRSGERDGSVARKSREKEKGTKTGEEKKSLRIKKKIYYIKISVM